MGRYINPGNDGFEQILRGRYVDKTGLVALFDSTLETPEKLVLVSRPRRFGKSFAAQSLVAFYSCGCDSRALFEGLEVAQREGWDEHLNAYNVVWLDMTAVMQVAGGADVGRKVAEMVLPELRGLLPEAGANAAGEGDLLASALWDVVQATGRRFVFVIDEWDAPYRLAQDDRKTQDAYAEWLRGLFKNGNFTPEVVAGAYMTGILPIKKYAHQSAVSDFDEFTMVDPAQYVPYVGFTEGEVEALCSRHGLDLDDVRHWYDGYDLPAFDSQPGGPTHVGVYAPYSVMRACARRRTGSYWPSTETFEELRYYIDMDFEGLQGDVLRAIGGEELRVDPGTFNNDMTSVGSRDDALTLLVHLGYLCYDLDARRARVPNEEVRLELRRAVGRSRHARVARVMLDSIRLVGDVLARDEQSVAAAIGRAHDAACAPVHYNGEQALRAVVKAALVAATDDWACVDELPSGHGYADVAYLPRAGSGRPALLVELKWDEPVRAAVDQVLDRDYPQVLRGLGVPILVVAVTYDAKTKEHSCRIFEA
ncbi:MAG: AAA family ATPase [Coriobacteriales bacterium]|nr:AAA family ATPase [Coriobacteriales bacterium]